MTRFVGTHFGKLDRKGRISVPASFRAELEKAGDTQLAFRVSHQHPCIEVRTRAEFDAVLDRIRSLDQYSEDREAWETSFVAATIMLRCDSEGRLVLPEEMVAELGLAENIAFLGKSERFEIWDAVSGKAHLAAALARVRENRPTLPPAPLNTTPRGMQ